MSLYSKIKTIFIIALLLLTAFFGAYFYIHKSQYLQKIEKRYMQTSFFIHRYFRESHQMNLSDEGLELFLAESRFVILSDQEAINRVKNRGFVLLTRKLMRSKIAIKRVRDRFYLLIYHPRFSVVLQDFLW